MVLGEEKQSADLRQVAEVDAEKEHLDRREWPRRAPLPRPGLPPLGGRQRCSKKIGLGSLLRHLILVVASVAALFFVVFFFVVFFSSLDAIASVRGSNDGPGSIMAISGGLGRRLRG